MEAAHPTAGWEKVGDRFYRKTQLYTAVFDRDLDLDNYIVAGAPYGGAIGMTNRFPHLHLFSSHAFSRL
jgi:vacuolar protein sorting-associated protein 16